jgi:hypothetical protein
VGGEGVGTEGAKKTVKLRDVMRVSGRQPQPPRVAAKYWSIRGSRYCFPPSLGGAGQGAVRGKKPSLVLRRIRWGAMKKE